MKRREAIKWTTFWAGAGLVSPAVITALQSCSRGEKKPDWNPLSLSDEEVKRLEILGDIIIPKTDTPSASQVRVAEFIDLIVADVLSKSQGESISHVLTGLGNVKVTGGEKPLEDMETAEQVETVRKIDMESYADEKKDLWDEAFLKDYRYLKSLILMAYYTSEDGVVKNLEYVVIPGDYQPCIDISDNGKIMVGNHM